jgi:FkbM family methyltransferase
MSLLARINHRKRLIQKYAGLAWSRADRFHLGVLGFARANYFKSRHPVSWLGRRLFPSLRLRPRVMGGLAISVNPSDWTHVTIFDEVVIEQVYDLSLVPFVPELVIDCGAHIGFFSVLAAGTFPKATIIAYEPNPKNLAYLRQQVTTNHSDISIVPAAVSIREGESWFGGELSFGGQLQSGPASANDGRYLVKLVDLPAKITELAGKNLLLKLDIEGEEITLVPGCLHCLPAQCAIFFETHGGDEAWTFVSTTLSSAGFNVRMLRDREVCKDGFAVRPLP